MKVNKVVKVGHSWMVAIPRTYLLHIGLNLGDYAKVVLNRDKIIITKLGSRKDKEVE